MIEQIINEDIYGNKSLYNMLMDEIKEINLKELEDKILTWKTEPRHSSIKVLIDRVMVSSEWIAKHLAIYSISKKQTIQELTMAITRVIKEDASLNYYQSLIVGGELIGLGKNILYTIDTITQIVTSKYKLTGDIVDYINLRMYIPPQIEPPREWINNTNGGYQSFDSHIQLGKFPQDVDQALDVINYLQNIPLKLDNYIINMEIESNKVMNGNALTQFLKFKEQVKKLYAQYKNRVFYFIVKFDKRGRMYTCGYHINIQGQGFQKAAISLANTYYITGDL